MKSMLIIGVLGLAFADTSANAFPNNNLNTDLRTALRGQLQPIVIDESYGDWIPGDLRATDPAGDSSTGYFDLTRVWARGDGSTLYLSFEIAGIPRNTQSGDASDGSPMILVTGPDGRSIAMFHRSRQMFEVDANGDPVRFIGWTESDFALLPTVASNRYEARIDLAPIGVGEGDTVQAAFSVQPWDGPQNTQAANLYRTVTSLEIPDDLGAPFAVTMAPQTPRGISFDPGRAPGTDLRLASQNMLAGSLFDPSKTETAILVLKSLGADVYCLQEQNGTPTQIESIFNLIDPLGNGAAWTAVTDFQTSAFSSDFIVTHLPIQHISGPSIPSHFAVALIGETTEDALLVFSIHPKCCGYTGSAEDTTRILQTRDIIDVIEQFRAAELGTELAPFAGAPVAVLGDWNLVGSDEPRRLLTTPDSTPSLDHVQLLAPDGRDATTWRDLDDDPQSFTPGLLDLVVLSPQNLAFKGGYVLDSELLDGPTRDALGLEADDSRFSDHLALVVDVAFRGTVADFNDDGVLDLADIVGFIAAFSNGESQADLSGPDGQHDLADLVAFIEAFTGAGP